MSEELDGWIAIQRRVFKAGKFKDTPFSEREAWIWLIAKAVFKPTTHRIGSTVYDVPRGSRFYTIRELMSAWKWGNTKVRNYLVFLEKQDMAVSENKSGKTLVTICNYNEYQFEKSQTNQAQITDKPETNQDQITKEQDKQISSSLHSEDNTNPLSLSEPKKSPRKKAAPKSTISETWEPDQGCIDKAYSVGMDRTIIDVEAENFRNHHFNKQSKMVSWSLAWGTWCNNWKKFQANKPQSFKAKNKPSEFDVLDELADRIEAQGVIQ
jgi:hypothetical protein